MPESSVLFPNTADGVRCETGRNGSPTGADSAVATAPEDGAGEPCPTPLSGGQVQDVFDREAERRFVSSNGGKLAFRVWGAGPPLYFVRGLTGTSSELALLVYLLRDDFRCVILEPEHEAHEPPRRVSATPQTLAEGLFATADELGDAILNLVSLGSGCMTAWHAALDRPERIRALFVQGGAARITLSVTERLLTRLGSWMPGRLRHLPGSSNLLAASHRMWFPPFDADRWHQYATDALGTPAKAFARRVRAVSRCDFRERLGSLRVPVTLLRSEGEGRSVADKQEELIRLLPACTVEMLHTAGRLPHITHPHRVAKIVRNVFPPNDMPG